MMLLRLAQMGTLLLAVATFGCQGPKWTIQQSVTPDPVQYGAEYTATCKVGGDLKKVDHVKVQIQGAPGEEAVVLRDDGKQGDQKAGDGVFTLTEKPPVEAVRGKYDLEFIACDAEGNPVMVPSFRVLDEKGEVLKEVGAPAEKGKESAMLPLSTMCSIMLEKWEVQVVVSPNPLLIGKKFKATCKVSGDLSKVGSVSAVPVVASEGVDLHDDGQNGDETAGDGVFTIAGVLPDVIEAEDYDIEFIVYDKQNEMISVPYFAVLDKSGAVVKEVTAKAEAGKAAKAVDLVAPITVTAKRPAPEKKVAKWSVQYSAKPDPIKIGKKFEVRCKLTGDLSKIGWVSAVPIVAPEFSMELKDDGKAGDAKAGDGIFTIVSTPPGEAEPGQYEIECIVYDKNGDPLQVPSFTILDKDGKTVLKEILPKSEGGKKAATVEASSIITVNLE
ncbi:MAG: hypothetical protein JXQ73_30460 [Phycisphaerae bacterium]|nr:hypothetical protein [Phycisphaerae bacterium]